MLSTRLKLLYIELYRAECVAKLVSAVAIDELLVLYSVLLSVCLTLCMLDTFVLLDVCFLLCTVISYVCM